MVEFIKERRIELKNTLYQRDWGRQWYKRDIQKKQEKDKQTAQWRQTNQRTYRPPNFTRESAKLLAEPPNMLKDDLLQTR